MQRVRGLLSAWQLAAIALVPLWVIVGASIFEPTSGGDGPVPVLLLLVALTAQPALAILGLLRRAVRTAPAMSWADAIVLVVATGEMIAAGFEGPTAGASLLIAVVAYALGLWLSVAELVRGVRRRARQALDALGLGRPPVVLQHH